MTYKDLKKNVGVCRRFAKIQYKKLLKSYAKNGMCENFGQSTILNIDDYISKKLVISDLSYNDYQDMKQDLRAFNGCFIDALCTSHNRTINVQDASNILDDYVFFESVDFSKYNY